MRKQGSGWHGESRKHSLARRGIKTAKGQIKSFDINPNKEDPYSIDPKYLPPLEEFWIYQYPVEIYDEYEGITIEGWRYEIMTPHDASVGIFGEPISPTFESLKDLQIWWHINGNKANEIWNNSELEGQEFWDTLHNSLSGKWAVKQWKEYAKLHKQGEEYARTGRISAFKGDSRLEALNREK